jgi:endonuclease YncB( thermonuclease family)
MKKVATIADKPKEHVSRDRQARARPVVEVNEGDSVVVHVVNKSPHKITIHW